VGEVLDWGGRGGGGQRRGWFRRGQGPWTGRTETIAHRQNARRTQAQTDRDEVEARAEQKRRTQAQKGRDEIATRAEQKRRKDQVQTQKDQAQAKKDQAQAKKDQAEVEAIAEAKQRKIQAQKDQAQAKKDQAEVEAIAEAKQRGADTKVKVAEVASKSKAKKNPLSKQDNIDKEFEKRRKKELKKLKEQLDVIDKQLDDPEISANSRSVLLGRKLKLERARQQYKHLSPSKLK